MQDFNRGKDKCLNQVAGNFLKEITIKGQSPLRENRSNPTARRDRLGELMELAGGSRSKIAKDGWLWQRAMDHSGGDKDLAMRLISICSPGGISNYSAKDLFCQNTSRNGTINCTGEFRRIDLPGAQASDFQKAERESYQLVVDYYDAYQNEDSELAKLNAGIEQLRNLNPGLGAVCPSLGREAFEDGVSLVSLSAVAPRFRAENPYANDGERLTGAELRTKMYSTAVSACTLQRQGVDNQVLNDLKTRQLNYHYRSQGDKRDEKLSEFFAQVQPTSDILDPNFYRARLRVLKNLNRSDVPCPGKISSNVCNELLRKTRAFVWELEALEAWIDAGHAFAKENCQRRGGAYDRRAMEISACRAMDLNRRSGTGGSSRGGVTQ